MSRWLCVLRMFLQGYTTSSLALLCLLSIPDSSHSECPFGFTALMPTVSLKAVRIHRFCSRADIDLAISHRGYHNGGAAFQAQERPHRQVEEKQKRIEFLEKKVQTKDEVLAELMAEHVALKKTLGEL